MTFDYKSTKSRGNLFLFELKKRENLKVFSVY